MTLKDSKEEKSFKMKTFEFLQYNIARIFDRNSSNAMFCSELDFIGKILSLNLCHCYLK